MNFTLRSFYSHERTPVPVDQEVLWAPQPIRMFREKEKSYCRCLKIEISFLNIFFQYRFFAAASVVQGQRAGLQYPSSRVQTRPKPSDFQDENILSTPSFGGEVKPSVPCRRFAACKRSLNLSESRNLDKTTGHFLVHSSTFRCQDLSHRCGRTGTWRRK